MRKSVAELCFNSFLFAVPRARDEDGRVADAAEGGARRVHSHHLQASFIVDLYARIPRKMPGCLNAEKYILCVGAVGEESVKVHFGNAALKSILALLCPRNALGNYYFIINFAGCPALAARRRWWSSQPAALRRSPKATEKEKERRDLFVC